MLKRLHETIGSPRLKISRTQIPTTPEPPQDLNYLMEDISSRRLQRLYRAATTSEALEYLARNDAGLVPERKLMYLDAVTLIRRLGKSLLK